MQRKNTLYYIILHVVIYLSKELQHVRVKLKSVWSVPSGPQKSNSEMSCFFRFYNNTNRE
jgi:hypothetical protein